MTDTPWRVVTAQQYSRGYTRFYPGGFYAVKKYTIHPNNPRDADGHPVPFDDGTWLVIDPPPLSGFRSEHKGTG
jgi:hypothetical protein